MATKSIIAEPLKLSPYAVAVTAMLSFVSFWRAAAVVLSDVDSTAYYIGLMSVGWTQRKSLLMSVELIQFAF
jgi:hypothetical protein